MPSQHSQCGEIWGGTNRTPGPRSVCCHIEMGESCDCVWLQRRPCSRWTLGGWRRGAPSATENRGHRLCLLFKSELELLKLFFQSLQKLLPWLEFCVGRVRQERFLLTPGHGFEVTSPSACLDPATANVSSVIDLCEVVSSPEEPVILNVQQGLVI